MIHQYKLNGYNIVIDVFSASVHVTDDLAYDAIAGLEAGKAEAEVREELKKAYPNATAEDIQDTFDDIEELKTAGKLFFFFFYENVAFKFKERNTVIKALCLLVAHTCNLNCSYCFAAQGKFAGQTGTKLMDF